MDKAVKIFKMTEKKAKHTIEQKKIQEKIQYEKDLKVKKKNQLYTAFNDHMKEETSTLNIDTNLLAKYKKELNDAIAQREKLEKKLKFSDEELFKQMQETEEQEKSIFLQSFYNGENQTLRGQDSMAFKGSSVSKFQKTLQSTYITKSQQMDVDQLHGNLDKLKDNNERVNDMIEIQQENQLGLNAKIKDIRFSIGKVQKEINDYKSVREITDRRFNDLDTRQINAIKKQKHVNDQLQAYRKEMSHAKEKENQYLNDIRTYKNQLEQEIFELQDEIAGYMTQIELRNNDIVKQQQQIGDLDNKYNEINQKLANSNIIQNYLESFEIIHKSFIKDLVSQIGDEIYTMDQNNILGLLEKFVQMEKKKVLRKQNKNATQILEKRKDDIAMAQNTQTEAYTETVDRSGMVLYLQEFYDEYNSPDDVVEELIQTFKEYTILNNSLYSRYEELISLKKIKNQEIDKLQEQINEISGHEEELDELQEKKVDNMIKPVRHDSQLYPVTGVENGENQNQEQDQQQQQDENQQNQNQETQETKRESQETQENEDDKKEENQQEEKQELSKEEEERLKYEKEKQLYEERHNLSKMKFKIENEKNSTKLSQLASNWQSFSFKLFFGLMESLYRYSVALKLILEYQNNNQDQELVQFYHDFKQFVATFRLGFAPKREQNKCYVKITNQDVNKEYDEEQEKRQIDAKRQSSIVFDGLSFKYQQQDSQGNNQQNNNSKEEKSPGKRESYVANVKDVQEEKQMSYQESQVEKFIEVSNFIPLESYEIVNLFLQVFPTRKAEAEQFQKLIKQDLTIQFMISKQTLVKFLKKKAQAQYFDNESIDMVFIGFQELKQEAMQIYHKMLKKGFEYYTKFTKIMETKYTQLFNSAGIDVQRWHKKMKEKGPGKQEPKSQIEFNMKVIEKLIEEKKNPDFDRLEYPLNVKKDHKQDQNEEGGKPKTSDWKKIIYKLADDSKKSKVYAEYSNQKRSDQDEEENINLFDKEAIEQKRLQNMDEDEFLEHQRKKLNGRNKDHMGQSSNEFSQNINKSQGKTTNNFYQNHKNESKEYLRHFLENEKVIWSLRTLELQHKKYDSKNSKIQIDDYIPKKLSNTNNNSLMSNTYKPRTTESLSRKNKYQNSQSNNFFDSKNKNSQIKSNSKPNKLNPISESQKKKSISSSIKSPEQKINNINTNQNKKRSLKRGNKSQQLPKIENKFKNELYKPILHPQTSVNQIKDNNYYIDDGKSNIQGSFNQETRYNKNNIQNN